MCYISVTVSGREIGQLAKLAGKKDPFKVTAILFRISFADVNTPN